ncbi:MAG: pyrroline-5-carboxylate reductase [Spirochaetales bacterium]
MQIGFIGAGNMACALAEAIDRSATPSQFMAFDPDRERLERFASSVARFARAESNREVAEKSSLTFLAVKPQMVSDVLPELTSCNRLIVSIAAGVTLATLQDAMPEARVVRVMPNTPSLVGRMAAGYAVGAQCSEDDRNLVAELLSRAGVAFELAEEQLDAVTGLSGSGPAFVARLIEAFTDAGTKLGLDPSVAYTLAFETFAGTAALLAEKQLTPDELVTMVSSPNGTTVAGRAVLENSEYKSIISETVAAAAKRSKELGS